LLFDQFGFRESLFSNRGRKRGYCSRLFGSFGHEDDFFNGFLQRRLGGRFVLGDGFDAGFRLGLWNRRSERLHGRGFWNCFHRRFRFGSRN
jgi:hypothetical protein